jgi:hypothetical protein
MPVIQGVQPQDLEMPADSPRYQLIVRALLIRVYLSTGHASDPTRVG